MNSKEFQGEHCAINTSPKSFADTKINTNKEANTNPHFGEPANFLKETTSVFLVPEEVQKTYNNNDLFLALYLYLSGIAVSCSFPHVKERGKETPSFIAE